MSKYSELPPEVPNTEAVIIVPADDRVPPGPEGTDIDGDGD